jgi:hypothetical protein
MAATVKYRDLAISVAQDAGLQSMCQFLEINVQRRIQKFGIQ